MTITYLIGDATNPQVEGNKLIIHICNNVGGWGSGFVVALSKKWKAPEQAYRKWFAEYKMEQDEDYPFRLGMTRFVNVEKDIWVANMIAQKGYGKVDGPAVRYDALAKCLQTAADGAKLLSASIHMPRIGCGLGGGKWEDVEPIINEHLGEFDVYVYDLK